MHVVKVNAIKETRKDGDYYFPDIPAGCKWTMLAWDVATADGHPSVYVIGIYGFEDEKTDRMAMLKAQKDVAVVHEADAVEMAATAAKATDPAAKDWKDYLAEKAAAAATVDLTPIAVAAVDPLTP